MPYLAIDDFKSGLDARKSVMTAPAGSLTRLINAIVTPGGEIQKRRAFKKVATLTGTKGLAAIGSTVVAFKETGSTATAPSLGMTDAALEYHSLPGLMTTAKLIDFDVYDGSIYATFYDSAGGSPAAKNPHYFFDQSLTTPAYVQTEGSGKGYYVRAYQSKVYTVNGKYIFFSAIKYPKLWEEAAAYPPSGASVQSVLPATGYANERVLIVATQKTFQWQITNGIGSWVQIATDAADIIWISEMTQRTGAGFINTALQESGGRGLQGIDIYYDKLAVLSGETAQMWAMDPDPNQNALTQVLRATGTLAARSVQQYGSGDVLFLAPSGIRSLKARDASNTAAVTDVGSPIDNLIRQIGVDRGRTYLANAQAIIEPITGRFWLVFPDSIFVLSYFPGPKINAWSEFRLPFVIDYVVTAGDCIFVRSGDDLYSYGGTSLYEYDNCGVEVRFPYLDAGKPGHMKQFEAIDATVEGAWQASVSYNYDQPDAEEALGTLDRPTWGYGKFAMQGYASHCSMRFYNNTTGSATLSNVAIHYQMGADEA